MSHSATSTAAAFTDGDATASTARQLPDAVEVASIVTRVTQTMFGLTFRSVDRAARPELLWKSGALVIPAPAPVAVAITSDERSCRALSSKVFGCAEADVEPGMHEDSIRELVNMMAGQLNRAMRLDSALGLPHILPDASPLCAERGWHRISLRAKGIELEVWLADQPQAWAW